MLSVNITTDCKIIIKWKKAACNFYKNGGELIVPGKQACAEPGVQEPVWVWLVKVSGIAEDHLMGKHRFENDLAAVRKIIHK